MNNWFTISNVEHIDTPALAVYPERIQENIRILKTFAPDIALLRPHMKTNKSPQVAKMLIREGIALFKCATIAEAEMLAEAGAKDILLAYQPVGPKAERLATLTARYSQTIFSCLADNITTAKHISTVFERSAQKIRVYIDLNVGMNRTGIAPDAALELYKQLLALPGIIAYGLHAYDGHLRDVDLAVRAQKCNEAFAAVEKLRDQIVQQTGNIPAIVAGGTPTFPIHAQRNGVACSPGTFIYWDKGYQNILQEQPFLFAALVVTRVISLPAKDTICIDLGHKAIASENPLTNRVTFLNAPDLEPTGHSEEHMILKTPAGSTYQVGDVLYGVPYHICPTVALYDRTAIVTDNEVTDYWTTQARNRVITI
ncbi:MAG TPA: D-TA family PLP-dependent enzyme [Ohtaekwangia sp.]|uniref:D-TA family PLP-dependent enzyme n=1 Tax=Ohtaekwangia sp. TaxID=2066019 RepID=UPI002F958661